MSIETDPGDPIRAIARVVATAAANALGPVGATISAALKEILPGRASALITDRLESLQEALREEFAIIAASEFPTDFIQSQDFAHLVILAVQASARERDRRKIRSYARLLRAASTSPWDAVPERVEQALRALGDLTQQDFEVLRAIMERVETDEGSGQRRQPLRAEGLEPYLPDFPPDRIRPHLARLQRTGLVVEDTGAAWDQMSGNYLTTPLLEDLLILLR